MSLLLAMTGRGNMITSKNLTVVYFPYGKGVSSSELKTRIHTRFNKLREEADNHLPIDIEIK